MTDGSAPWAPRDPTPDRPDRIGQVIAVKYRLEARLGAGAAVPSDDDAKETEGND